MRQGDYFSVVESNALLDHTLTRVPLEDAPVINSAFLACQEALKNYPSKSFLNLLLLKAGYPIIE